LVLLQFLDEFNEELEGSCADCLLGLVLLRSVVSSASIVMLRENYEIENALDEQYD